MVSVGFLVDLNPIDSTGAPGAYNDGLFEGFLRVPERNSDGHTYFDKRSRAGTLCGLLRIGFNTPGRKNPEATANLRQSFWGHPVSGTALVLALRTGF